MASSKSGPSGLPLMSLNDNKAGMEGLDKERINAVIEEASRGSKFYAKQQEDQARIHAQVRGLQQQLDQLCPADLSAAEAEADAVVANLRAGRDLSRTIVHVDMDMFYAAVEMRDNPSLKDKPMAVGGMGMLSTSNYAARKFGVRAAMPGFIAKKLCPDLVIVPCNMSSYAREAEKIREVFRQYDANYLPMSLDEAYMDLTAYLEEHPERTAAEAVAEMRAQIFEVTGLTASAGIAPNTFLAKVCSDMNKPNGQFQLQPTEAAVHEFVDKLPIRKAAGIGKVQEQLLNGIEVKTCRDLYAKRAEIKLLFSALSFENYMCISQGIGSTRLEPPEERIRKSISTETTFRDTADRDALFEICEELCQDLAKDMKARSIVGLAVTLKIKSHDFRIRTRVRQLAEYTNDFNVILSSARRTLVSLLDSADKKPLALRLMGVRMSELKDESELGSRQGSLLTYLRSSAGGPGVAQSAGRDASCSEPEVVATNYYSCPICSLETSGLDSLNSHLDSCVDNSDSWRMEGNSSKTFRTAYCKSGSSNSDSRNTAGSNSNSLSSAHSSKCDSWRTARIKGTETTVDSSSCKTIETDILKSVEASTGKCSDGVNLVRRTEMESPEKHQAHDMSSGKESWESNPISGETSLEASSLKVRNPVPQEGFFRRKMREMGTGTGTLVVSSEPFMQTKVVQPPEVALLPKSFECPVCAKTVLQDMENHVEDCLNRQAIKAMLRESEGNAKQSIKAEAKQAQPKTKRKSASAAAAENPPKKLYKAVNTIDAYFKR